ncbi:DEAD/DEAH box helicase [Rhodobacter sp. Har01]|uniref:DEAD/DEAH box helicase n=1 Tax=Rhodobacter sp. Har01 TaxID=2883999 RepID=UPI001D0827BF|nr:DEAD/DEAH box helicase [Rhodobacter sp. Har01]MCB6177860.1 DEAD/DEAH box helicase [Rhodobacter sp. Har01]
MDDLAIAGPLRAALAAKGYAALTSVQEAVLVPEAAGRDLLVSAQTGSGKTVAFGLAMAPEVLGSVERLMPAEKPLALVIAPTRELALQVKHEFEWLYAEAGVQLASCVGGMDYRTERRALDRGAHVVVGTPGRLRDHVERGSLDLSALKAVVLDEADEMLDMGFAEDLEFLLGSAPAEKRVLMFSATVPKEIEKLARTYQREALRVVAQGEAQQHADIEYQAVSVASRDKEPAIFNLLRFHEAQTAIVFCKTRANVNHLFARMVNRGFQVVALSGELSQGERMHALQALRDGRARVCIATDVAARGIDLPGLELVIHADLPTNPDTLLHRSGRTGRAGRKGLSVLVVPSAEFRKANRILQGAKVTAEWGKAPTAEEVQAREDSRLMSDAVLAAPAPEEEALVEAILDKHAPEALAAAFVRMWRKGRAAPEVLSDEPMPAAAPPVRPRGEFGAAVWFRLSVGHTGRAEARWLLPKVCEAGGVSKDSIGAIRVQQEVTFMQIAEAAAPRFGQSLEIEPGLVMERIEGEPDLARPERGAPRAEARPPRRDEREKPPYSPKPSRFVDEGEAGAAPEAAPRKPWVKKAEGEDRKPWKPREATAERKPYAPRDGDAPRKPYAPRDADAPRKPWAPRDGDAPRKPYAPRDGDAPRKPYAPRDGDAPRKPWVAREGAEGAAAKKPRWTPDDRAERGEGSAPAKAPYRSTGFKSHGGAAGKPARAAGYKSHAAEGTGFKPRAEGDRPAPKGDWKPREARAEDGDRPRKPGGPKPAGKSWGTKSNASAEKRPFATKKPTAPKTDPKDTSKRFTPPKKPRS